MQQGKSNPEIVQSSAEKEDKCHAVRSRNST